MVFDEYMNLVLDDAEKINVKKNTRKSLGYRKELRKDGIVCISKPANLYSHLLADSSLLD